MSKMLHKMSRLSVRLTVYRASHVLVDLGWVGYRFGEFPRMVGRYCSYLLPKQDGGTPQIIVDKTSCMTGRLRVYMSSPLVAVAAIECPNCSKLALLEGQQMATIATSDFLLLT